jgi:hypothetical protein
MNDINADRAGDVKPLLALLNRGFDSIGEFQQSI